MMSENGKLLIGGLKTVSRVFGILLVIALLGYGAWEWVFFERSYYSNGKLQCRVEVDPLANREHHQNGRVDCYYPDGKKKFSGRNKSHVWHGRRSVWNANGLLIEDWDYINGVPVDGNRKIYWHSGKLMLDETRHKGHLVGTTSFFGQENNFEAVCEYRNGAPYKGIEVRFVYDKFDIPSVIEMIPFEKWMRQGTAKYTLGQVDIEVHWKNDVIELKKRAYDNLTRWTGSVSGKPVLWATFRPEGLSELRFWLDQHGNQSSELRLLNGSFAGRLFRLKENLSRVELVE